VGWLLLWDTRGFSHLEQENNLGRPETGSFIINITRDVFHNIRRPQQTSVISYTRHTQRPLSDSSHKQCVPTLDNSGIELFLHRCGLQRTNLHSINIGAIFILTLFPLIHLLLRTLRKNVTRLMSKLVVSLHYFLSSPRV
jgi:hypothetical protein